MNSVGFAGIGGFIIVIKLSSDFLSFFFFFFFSLSSFTEVFAQRFQLFGGWHSHLHSKEVEVRCRGGL